MSLFRWLTARAEQRRAAEQASTDEANAAARAALPPTRATERLIATSSCPVCRALIDPDGVVQHQQWHDTHTPLQRIGDPL